MRKRLYVTLSAVLLTVAAVGIGLVNSPSASAAVGDFNYNQSQLVAGNLVAPWGMAFLPDGSALVSERDSARLLQLRVGQAPQVLGTIPGVVPGGEGGLMGLAVSPTYAQDQWVYAMFTAASDNRITRFRINALQTQQTVLTGLAKATIHNGGRIGFGPDGMLYAGVGDAGTTSNSQNLNSRNGKILRMTPTGGVPAGNPFANSLVYSYGHRNVQGLAWDAQGRLWATEFGQNTWDEVNQIVAGGNYGWPTVEGMSSNPNFRNPAVVWTTAEASPSGAAIVGNQFFAAALRGQRLWQVPLNGTSVGTPISRLQGQFGRLRTVALGPDGWLWVATSNRDGRGSPAANDDRVLRFPPLDTPTSAPPTTAVPTTTRPPTSAPPTTAVPTTTRPPTSAPPTTTRPPTSAPPGQCAVRWQVDQWNTGFVANLTVTNNGPAINGWALAWTFAGNQTITNAWNSVITPASGSVTARNAPWNPAIGTGGSVNFGFQATYSGTNARPASFTLNGTACTIT
jgi:glucose/arabinose dehydrogenase